MRPYLAILRDSFREAFASRTLPFLLIFFTIALAALAPIGLQEDVPWRLAFEEITDQTLWLAKIRQQAGQEGDNPGKRLLERLPDDLEARLGLGQQPAAADAGEALFLTNAINSEVLPDRTFYSEQAWDDVPLPAEARNLIGRGPANLSDKDLKRLNRLLLSAAYPGALKPPTDSRAKITYLGFEIPGVSGQLEQFFSETEMVRRIIRELIYAVCVWGIGPIGLLVGIVVTADVMPRTFEPGAIDLLLSKPVNRALIFLTKFFGACAFILISFSYLVAGLWLIVWLRLDVWAPQILAAIPLFLFSFAVIYAVSAVTGLLWRSPIVSVMVTVVVWGAAFLIGSAHHTIESVTRADERVRQIAPAGGTLVIADFGRAAYVWSEESGDWVERPGLVPQLSGAAAGNPLLRPKLLGPLYDPGNGRVVVAEAGAVGDNVLRFASAETNWRTSPGAKLPPMTNDLFVTRDGRLFAAGRSGLYEFRGDPTVEKKEFMIFGVLDLV
ncbi:MAG TPA: ABC transporter permease, partial [Planctomycetaceae bacterium]